MFLNKNTLVLKDGHLCIRHVTTDYSQPNFYIIYWPIGPCNKATAENLGFPLGDEMISLGIASYRPASQPAISARTYTLVDGGQTKPIATEVIAAKPPKTGGKELRWRDGRWQKLLKTTGWTEVPFVEIP